MADSGWIAVVGVAVGGGLAAGSALLQTYLQRRSDTANRRRQEVTDTANRKRQEVTERRTELKQIYTRYQLAIDGLDNAIPGIVESAPPRDFASMALMMP